MTEDSSGAMAPSRDDIFAIEAQGLSKSVPVAGGSLDILRGIDLQVPQGESLAIVGRSGSGKTTLLGLLAGLDVPTSGSIRLMGKALELMNEDERAAHRARQVGFVFQSFHLLPAMTALENVMLPLELLGENKAMAIARDFLCELGLQDRLDSFPSQLSGGEQQRVALARAFAAKPALLFADEPTGNLDGETGAEIIERLFALNAQQGTTLIMVTHDEALAQRCRRVEKMESGRLAPKQNEQDGQATSAGLELQA